MGDLNVLQEGDCIDIYPTPRGIECIHFKNVSPDLGDM